MGKTFASDNAAEVHPDIMKALEAANTGHALAYGRDEYTERAIAKFRGYFGDDARVYFVFGGTGANVAGLKAAMGARNSIICPDSAHIYTSECGASQEFIGCEFVPIKTRHGKLRVDDIDRNKIETSDDPGIISISQTTELGTVYRPEEVAELADYAHGRRMALHMDGARICNAAAYLGMDFDFTKGVDVLSFGGTKNGMMYGEAVVFLNPALAENFEETRIQATQRPSKMRYIAAQFDALLSDGLWLRNAEHANRMAQLLYHGVSDVPKVKVAHQVESNSVFATIPREYIQPLQDRYFFEVNEKRGEVRWMCAWDTTEEDVYDFARFIRETVK